MISPSDRHNFNKNATVWSNFAILQISKRTPSDTEINEIFKYIVNDE